MKRNLDDIAQELFEATLGHDTNNAVKNAVNDAPLHVVYGGAHLYTAETPEKLGRLALKSLETYAPNFVEFADALWLKGAEELPKSEKTIQDLEFRLADNPGSVKEENSDFWLAWSVYHKTIEKLKSEPIEDYRIDFEDGYGIRPDNEEDRHASLASDEMARAFAEGRLPRFSGFRIKSFQPETRNRAVRTLRLFLDNLLVRTGFALPPNFVVTLPKVKHPGEVEVLSKLLDEYDGPHSEDGLKENSIKIEILIETPEAILNMRDLVMASNGRCVAAHFGAYDYTSSFGITAVHQHLRHEACNFARNMMQVSLSPMGVRLSDSVTIEMPIPIHRGENLSIPQIAENKLAVKEGWRRHFNNVTHSMINGFYQSWDLHPAQLVARYGAVFSFFLESKDEQAIRLRGFLDSASQAMTTGNLFDDLASAEGLLNFFIKGIGCGAFEENEVADATGLTVAELRTGSFVRIMESRFRETLMD